MATHKNPAARAHLWQRPARPDELTDDKATPEYEYKGKSYALPRLLHDDDLATLRVETADQIDAALKDGWFLEPIPQTLYDKSGTEHQVSTVEERTAALAQGWSTAAPSGDALKDHDARLTALQAEIERIKAEKLKPAK